MSDRDRLIELINNAEYEGLKYEMAHKFYPFDDYKSRSQFVADYLLENGVIVSPCKVGDMVCYLNTMYHRALKKNAIYEAKVVKINTTYLGTCLVIHIRDDEGGCCETLNIKEWGKTVFLTKEQAERALKGREG